MGYSPLSHPSRPCGSRRIHEPPHNEISILTDSKPPFEIERITHPNDLAAIQPAWNALLESNQTKTPELTYEWQFTYWKYFNKNSTPFVIVVKEAGALVAIAPLKLTTTRLFGVRCRILEFMAARESNYQDFLIKDNLVQSLEAIAHYLVTNNHLWDVLALGQIPAASPTAAYFLKNLPDSLISTITRVEKCIFMKINKTWTEYAAISKKARAKIAIKKRRLEKFGEITAFHVLSTKQLTERLEQFFDMHRRRWKATGTPSQFHDNRYCQFYLDVSQQLLSRKYITLFVLEVGHIPVAFLYAFVFGRVCTQQLTAYDIRYAEASPSLVLHELFVKELFANDVDTFDFGHHYPYKQLWADSFKERVNLEVYPKRPICYYFYLFRKATEMARVIIRENRILRVVAGFIRRTFRLFSGDNQRG